MTNLRELYQKEIRKKLATELGIKNIMSVPRLLKIVINTGLGEALVNKKAIDNMSSQLAIICGQKPIITYSRQDISTFKLRKGEAIGLKVTLRGKKMFDFFERLVKIVLPRIRDFRGVPLRAFDNSANYTLGLKEQIVFPEIEYNQVDKVRGLEITFVTSSHDKIMAKRLLELLGIPFEKNK
ncbi:50S ribosomal protein L5 [Candidatus Gottesmanbacteria bacterium RBG_13_37_7]|uniref:Large ribosomal subunit protein uL5 n=1 Tax=Candidatus Gottesmanbacteria bacterium RBG_13_37_7 TaxID=1798369 RepID=A0A1F5YIW6_9BACT|nr:MAG: 50S ribosomal protein L5 [Candidatus Gottesmanbacteria bacterium RBG_13_37_7]